MKRAIVTGGSGLIGTAIGQCLQERGWQVASFDLKLGRSGARHIHCNVADETSVSAAFLDLGWESLDLLVNNAGKGDPQNGPIRQLSLESWRVMIDSHLTGAFLMARAAVPLLREGGSIIKIASTPAFLAEAQTEAYAAAMGGLVALTHARLGPKLRVNAIAPGWITDGEERLPLDHAQHLVGRAGRGDDIAEAVGYVASAGFITGQALTLDGGMSRKMIYLD